eukprot:m.95391 g.95391  ORF g.95391 m.95391 type:complete len:456 (-) comp15448_c0_seq2:424-1791(-)
MSEDASQEKFEDAPDHVETTEEVFEEHHHHHTQSHLAERIQPYAIVDQTPIPDTLKQPVEAPRESLPCTRPKSYSGLWSVLKSAVGQDLSRIAMPVQFNEPISFVQRLAEDLEYSCLLDKAAENDNSLIRLAYAAAFSSTCFTAYVEGHRVYKPFNPLLGETFELVVPEAGFRAVGEQTSHHPPITALHAESERGWFFREDYKCDTKFRGTLKIIPRGLARVEFPKYGDRITWIKPSTTVHNLIFGKVWVDQEGDVEVMNHATGEKCIMHWYPHSSAGKAYTQLYGEVFDVNGAVRYTLNGAWDKGLMLYEGHILREKLPKPDKAMGDCKAMMTLWSVYAPLEQAKLMYGLTRFAMTLNQMQPNICPTDCRLRPDERLLEAGDMDQATEEKRRLEEKQRKARKHRETTKEKYEPAWFKESYDPETDLNLYIYKGGYWDAKQSGSFANKSAFQDIY